MVCGGSRFENFFETMSVGETECEPTSPSTPLRGNQAMIDNEDDARDNGWDLSAPFSPRSLEDLIPGATLDGTSGVQTLPFPTDLLILMPTIRLTFPANFPRVTP